MVLFAAGGLRALLEAPSVAGLLFAFAPGDLLLAPEETPSAGLEGSGATSRSYGVLEMPVLNVPVPRGPW
ncbi:MAG: hypothetical protein ACRDV4_12725 [Acidimicrobiales bacterium]